MRPLRAALSAALILSIPTSLSAGPSPTGPALGAALAAGAVDPATFDFGALRYAPGQTLAFLGGQTGAQLAIAKAHDKPTWQAVVAARTCLTPSERMTAAGFDSALLAPDAAGWAQDKAAADAAFDRYKAARDAVLAGQSSPYPEFKGAEAQVAAAAKAKQPEVQALLRHQAADQLWRHAIVFGAPKAYAEGVGKAGAVWLNAQLADDGCAVDAAAAAWLKTTLGTVAWFDIKTYGKDADQAAWLIAEHADMAPDVQLLALDRMGQQVTDHQANAGNFAYLWDRVALNSGRPQRYGTQMRCVGQAWAPVSPIEDPAKLDERRRWVGLAPEAQYQRVGATTCVG